MATTQDKDEKDSPKKKGGKDLDDLKKEVPIVRSLLPTSVAALTFPATKQWALDADGSSTTGSNRDMVL